MERILMVSVYCTIKKTSRGNYNVTEFNRCNHSDRDDCFIFCRLYTYGSHGTGSPDVSANYGSFEL